MKEDLFLKIGARVHFQDDKGGKLHKVVVDPHTGQVTDLVILRGFLQRHDYVIPVSAVRSVTPEEVNVTLHVEELANYPEYREVEFDEWMDEWESELAYPREHAVVWFPQVGIYVREKKMVPVIRRRVSRGVHEGEVVIDRSLIVRTIHEVIGNVDHLWLDHDSWEITHLVARRSLVPHYVIIPFSKVDSITPEAIYIRGNSEQLREIPVSQWHLELVKSFSKENDLYSLDESLAISEEVSGALAADPRTAASVIEVIYEHGVVTLIGEVDSELVHRAAEEIAHQHARVVSVVNALEVRPKDAIIDTMASTVGQLVAYAYGAEGGAKLLR
jgi:uncharacterized protein YrrD